MLPFFVFAVVILPLKKQRNLSQFMYYYRKGFVYYCREDVKPWQEKVADTSLKYVP